MNSIQYSPDIVERIETHSRKAAEKRKVLQDFLGLLQDRATLEDYYSRNLEKISESLTRLIHGKDHMKELFLIMRNFISIQAEQSRGLARAIKNDVAIEIQGIINNDIQILRDSQILSKRHSKEIREQIDRLNQIRNEYIISIQEDIRLNQNSNYKRKFPKSSIQCEQQLQGFIDIYNKYIDQYFSDISQVQDSFTKLEIERRTTVQNTTMKYLMYEVSLVRNIQYDLSGITQKIEQFNPRLDLQELFKEIPSEKPLLCKLNFQNYQGFLHQQLNYDPSKIQQLQEQQKRKKLIFDEQKLQTIPHSQIRLNLDGNEAIIVKMFQNALFNNVVPDEAIQNLQSILQSNTSLINQFIPSLEKVLNLSVNQQEDGRYEVSALGYVSLLRILNLFIDSMNFNLTGDFTRLIKMTNKIYKKVQRPNDENSHEEISLTKGLSNHNLYQKIDFWLLWGKQIILNSQNCYEERQHEMILNEMTCQNEYVLDQLMEYTKLMKEFGCSESLCTLTKKELINQIQNNEEKIQIIQEQKNENLKKNQKLIQSSVFD